MKLNQIKWFDRKFEFLHAQNIFPSILERLEGTPLRLNHKINILPIDVLTRKVEGKWSIQENIGHLNDLEPLWQGRLEDILNGEEYLRTADLENTKTDLGRHNENEVSQLLEEFQNYRSITMDKLKRLATAEIYQHALHPRLKTPMRVMDLFHFVAEHDDHHLARITELNKFISSKRLN